MRSFFSKLGGNTSKTAEASRSSESDLPTLLAKAADLLKQLRSATEEDFPLLNEATRHVQLLEGSVAALPEGDPKTIWRTQIAELQKELKSSTERMLSSNRPAPVQDAGASLFEGMNLAASAFDKPPQASSHPEQTTQSMGQNDDVTLTGLSVGSSPDRVVTPSKAVTAMSDTAVSTPIQGVSSGPLPEDLFSGLEDLSMGIASSDPTTKAAALDLPSAMPVSHTSQGPTSPPALLRQGSDLSSTSSVVSAALPAISPSPGGMRRKRITRRVGYARDAADDDNDAAPPRSTPPATPGRDSIPVGMAMTAAELGRPAAELSGADSQPAAAGAQIWNNPLTMLGPEIEMAPQQASASERDPHFPGSAPAGILDTAAVGPMPQTPYSPAGISYDAQVGEGQAAEGSSQAALSGRGEADTAALEERLRDAAARSLAAKQRRRSLLADIAACTKELDETTIAEAAAVEAEDFERAANLSAKADSAKARLATLDQDLGATDAACSQAVTARLDLAAQQAKQHSDSAAALRGRQEELEQKSAEVASAMAQAQAAAEEAAASSAEHLEELHLRVEARQRWLEGEEVALAAKVTEATAPAAAERDRHLSAASALRQEVEHLRAMLAEKEAELAGAEADHAASEAQVQALSAKYDRAQSLLQRDRDALAAQQAELDDARADARTEAERAAATAAQLARRQEELQAQAESARAAAEEMLRASEATAQQVESEQRILRLHASLAAAEESAKAALRGVEQEMENARAAARALMGQRAGLLAEARAAEEAALAARQRVPELEAEKRAAAAARDFKEAARLSAESKAQSAEAEASTARAKEFRSRAAGLESNDAALTNDVARLYGEVQAGERVLALAKWRSVKAAELDTKLQIEAAVSAEKFEEASTLQAEHDAAAADAAAIASAHGFTASDLGDALRSLTATPDAAAPGNPPLVQPALEESHGNAPVKSTSAAPGSMQLKGDEKKPAGDAEDSDFSQPGAAAAPLRAPVAYTGPRSSMGARSTSHVATDGSESVCSLSLASDGNLSSDADGHAPLPGPAADVAAPPRPAAAVRALLQTAGSREALREAQLDRQLSEGDCASGYLADSDSVRERLALHGSYSSIDSIITGAGGLIRHPSGKLPVAGRAGRGSEPTVHTLEEAEGEVEGQSGHPVPALDLEQIREGKENGSNNTGRGSDAGDLLSGREELQQGYEQGMFGGLSMAEAAHMHHIDNAGSTAGTMGGDSTQWGGSDAGAGDILGSARSIGAAPGAHADAAFDEDAAESHYDASAHNMHSGPATPEVHLNGAHKGDNGQKVSEEGALARTHSGGSVHSFPSMSSPPASASKIMGVAEPGVPLPGEHPEAEETSLDGASGDMFAGLMLGS